MSDPVIAVVIPTIPTRNDTFLRRALQSVRSQTLPPTAGVFTAVDILRGGGARTRQAALNTVDPTAEWVSFLDDDDEMDPNHLRALYDCAAQTGADYVYSWPRVVGGLHPFPSWFGVPWNNQRPHQTTITVLVRRELAQQVGFLRALDGGSIDGQTWGEDYQFTLGCMQAGAKIVHLPELTWTWHHHGGNTSGQPDRW